MRKLYMNVKSPNSNKLQLILNMIPTANIGKEKKQTMLWGETYTHAKNAIQYFTTHIS